MDFTKKRLSSVVMLAIHIIITVLWLVMVFYTVVPFLFGMHVSALHKNLDLSIITVPLIVASTVNTALWIAIYSTHHFVIRQTVNHQRSLILKNSRHGEKNSRSQPLVSIIIPARNEENVIKKTVLNCLRQTYKNIEVLVICHNCQDSTYHEALQVHDSRARIFVLNTNEAGKGIALNYGIDKAKGGYVCIIDSDGKMDENFLEYSLPLFDEGYAAIQGRITASNRDYSLVTKLLAIEGDIFSIPFMNARSFLGRRTPLGGTGIIITKDILIEVGKFGNSLIDDFELSFRLYRNKYRVAFAPLSIVYDEKPPTLDGLYKQRSRWVKGHIDLLGHRVSESTDIIGIMYWLSPVFTTIGLAAICITSFAIVFYIFNGYYPYNFAYFPVKMWLIVTFTMFALQISVLIRETRFKRLRGVVHTALLMVFANYWYALLIKAFFVKSWADTKTTHGYETPSSSMQQHIDLGEKIK